jgi:GH24 family phage-related lysozyme (muramidase)
MKIDAHGLHLIAGFEGFVDRPYNDSAGNATIGYGHLIHRGPVTLADQNVRRGGLLPGVAAYNGSGPAAAAYANTVIARANQFASDLHLS